MLKYQRDFDILRRLSIKWVGTTSTRDLGMLSLLSNCVSRSASWLRERCCKSSAANTILPINMLLVAIWLAGGPFERPERPFFYFSLAITLDWIGVSQGHVTQIPTSHMRHLGLSHTSHPDFSRPTLTFVRPSTEILNISVTVNSTQSSQPRRPDREYG